MGKIETSGNRVLIFSLVIQLAVINIYILNFLGINVFFLKQMLVFIYLSFIPGILVIGILKMLNKLDTIEIVLYSVALSNSFLMVLGLIINWLYPILGILRPISKQPLIITVGICNFVLWVLYFIMGERIANRNLNLKINYFFFILLLFLSVFGTYFLTYYNCNFLLLFMFAIIAVIPVLAFKLSEKHYPIILWAISISLLFQTSLVGTVVPNGGDASSEYYFSKLVLNKGRWYPNISSNNCNSMLRIVMLHPIYSILLGINLTWEYKIVHPIIFALVPVALYLIYEKQTNKKIGFLSSCLFMFLFPFFTTLSMNTRTGMAIFYMILIVLLIIDNKLPKVGKIALYSIFSFSLITSHYGTGWLFMFVLLIGYILILICKNYVSNKLKFSEFLNFKLVVLYIILAMLWYTHTSKANVFRNTTLSIYNILKHALTSLGFNVKTSYTVYAMVREWAPTIEIIKYLFLIVTCLSVIGILNVIWTSIRGTERFYNFNLEYVVISSVFLCLFLATLLPKTRSVAPIRIYTLSMVFLSPFCVIGFVSLLKIFNQNLVTAGELDNKVVMLFSIFLLILILFNSGFFSEVFIKDYSPNILIHKKKLMRKNISADEIDDRILRFYRWYFPECDVLSGEWLSKMGNQKFRVYAQLGGPEGVLNAYGSYKIRDPRFINFPRNHNIEPKEQSYVYLRYFNYVQGIILSQIYPRIKWYSTKLLKLYIIGNKIYCNNGSAVYYLEPKGSCI